MYSINTAQCCHADADECAIFFFYLFEIEEEAGVLSSFGEVGEKHCDTDEEHRGVLAHLTQRLDKENSNTQLKLMHSSRPTGFNTDISTAHRELTQVNTCSLYLCQDLKIQGEVLI